MKGLEAQQKQLELQHINATKLRQERIVRKNMLVEGDSLLRIGTRGMVINI